jgi:hypothetical protein
MITSTSVAEQIRRSRHSVRGTITTIALSDTEVDEMNRPAEVPTVTAVEFLWAPASASETNDTRDVSKAERTVYLASDTVISTTSKLTHAGLQWEVVAVEEWPVGIVATVTRTV